MKNRIVLCCLCAALTGNVSALMLSGGGSYTRYNNGISTDNTSFTKRLSIGEPALFSYKKWSLGVEFGIQDGHTQRLSMNATNYANLGSVAVQTTFKPFVDALVEVSHKFGKSDNAAVFAKGGVAYRQLYFDRDTVNSLHKYNPELQVGVRVNVKDNISIELGYQGIFGGNATFTTNAVTATGHLNKIPSQHGALLTVNWLV
jgi:opacity protein-like surface antigen